MKADIVITGATITPNPVYVGASFILSVEIKDATFVLGEDSYDLSDSDGALILVPDGEILCLSTGNDNEILVDSTGEYFDMEE